MLSREDSPWASYPVPPDSHSYARSQAVKQEDCIVETSEVEADGDGGKGPDGMVVQVARLETWTGIGEEAAFILSSGRQRVMKRSILHYVRVYGFGKRGGPSR